jgi:cobyrinic acid a,c-diamide synthase
MMPAALKIAYVEVQTKGGLFGANRTARGHVFHRSEISGDEPPSRCYRVQTSRGERSDEGFQHRNVLASYIHLHFASDPGIASVLVDRCAAFRTRRRN